MLVERCVRRDFLDDSINASSKRLRASPAFDDAQWAKPKDVFHVKPRLPVGLELPENERHGQVAQ